MTTFRSIVVLMGCYGWVAAELIADEQAVAGRDAVRRALGGVDRWLQYSPHAAAWHTRLDTQALRSELAKKGRPDLAAVERWLERMPADRTIAARPPSALRRSVEAWLTWESLCTDGRYLPAVAASILRSSTRSGGLDADTLGSQKTRARSPELSRSELRTHLVALTAMLSRYSRQADEGLAQGIDEELTWLEAANEATMLVHAVRQYYNHPNVWIDVSEDLLDDPVIQTIDRPEPVNDMILGTPVTGNSRLQAESDLEIHPDSDRAILKIVVRGHVDAQTTGRRGPAKIHSGSTTTFKAEKRLVIEQTGVKVLPTVCRAELSETGSNISTVKGGLRGRIVGRIAERRWQASRDAAHEEAARHVEQRVAAAIDRQANQLIGRLDRLVLGPMLVLANSGLNKQRIRFCSDHGMLRIGICLGRLGAPPGLPPTDTQRLFTVRVHSSLVNPVAAFAPSLSELSWMTPSKVVESVALLSQPERFFQTSLETDSPSPTSPLKGRFWQGLAWKWVDRTFSPRLDAGGIVLRHGQWGRLTPSIGDDWAAVEWQPVAGLASDRESPATELSARLRSLR